MIKIKYYKKLLSKRKFLILVIIGILIAPIFSNWLMFQGSWKVAGSNSDWIGFFGSYIGAIFGGLITLLGVKLTIDAQEKRIKLDNYPRKIRIIHGMIKKLNILNDYLVNRERGEKFLYDEEFIKKQIDELLDEASIIDNLVFSNILSLETKVIDILLNKYQKCIIIDEYGDSYAKVDADFYSELIDTMEQINYVIGFFNKYNNKLRSEYNDANYF